MSRRTKKQNPALEKSDIEVFEMDKGGFVASMLRGIHNYASGDTEQETAITLARSMFGELARVRCHGGGLYQVHFNQEEAAKCQAQTSN